MEVATSPSQSLAAAKPPFHLTSVCLYYTDSKIKNGGGPDDFEFEPHVLHRQYDESPPCLQEQEQQQQQKLMSFADELFHSGYLVPLKLPPRLQTVQSAHCSRLSSRATSPISRRSPFARCSPKSEDVDDPFIVALEKVRMEDCSTIRKGRGSSPGRRARSLSPLRSSNCWFGEQEMRNQSMNNNHMPVRELRPENANVPAGTENRQLSRRKAMKKLLSMSSLALKKEAHDDGKRRDWMKVFRATRKRMSPMAKWHGPFMCFMCSGHAL